MRNSPERFELDDYDEAPKPRRKAKPAQQAQARAIALPRPQNPMLAVLIARPGATIACAAFAALMTGIAVNALLLQKGRHPAPLFSVKPALQQAAPATAPAVVQPKAPPADDDDAPAPAQPKSVAPSPPVRPAALAEAKPAAKPEPKSDSIGALLRNGPVASDQGKTVAAAQRALAKLGHAVKADDAMGPGTRQAIEKFERDNKLPVTGELNPRTMRKLSAVAGMPVE